MEVVLVANSRQNGDDWLRFARRNMFILWFGSKSKDWEASVYAFHGGREEPFHFGTQELMFR